MKLSISNIAWSAEHDACMYRFLGEQGFSGLEIAPARVFPQEPYKHIKEAKAFAGMLQNSYGLSVSSIQSIWYGRTESIFGSDKDRAGLIEYTKKAIRFAEALSCANLVFGCPRNRNMPSPDMFPAAIAFFTAIARYACEHRRVIALEPNPPVYNTNFINTTEEAFELCNKINSVGLRVNIDLGTVLYNNENLNEIKSNIHLVHHIHISEPLLALIEKRTIHYELKNILNGTNYQGYVSIEMKNTGDIGIVKQAVRYIREVFFDL
jgi:sugar phosphate isomerase/epimerase